MRLLVAAIAAIVLGSAECTPSSSWFDILIRNGRIVDGTGNPWYRADIGIRSGRIVEIGQLSRYRARRTIDAAGRVVAPGFIDMMGGSALPLVTDPVSAASKWRQGITTMMVGEGGSPAPQNDRTMDRLGRTYSLHERWHGFADYFAVLERHGLGLNVVHNVGAGQVREVVVGVADVTPTPDQLAKMQALVGQAMDDGAVGLSSALIYVPDTYAKTSELIALATVVARYGGTYFTHIRNESGGLLDAIREAVRIGAAARVPVHIFHLKAAGEANWALMTGALALIDSARRAGIDVTADVYPYIRNGIELAAFIPPEHFANGVAAFLPTLHDNRVRAALRLELEARTDWENWYQHVGRNWDNVLITDVGPAGEKRFLGLSLHEAAAQRGVDDWTTFFDLVEAGNVNVSPRSMNEEQKDIAMRAPFVAFDTDAEPTNPAKVGSAHPRAFGTFPRILAKYVRDEHVVALEDAIRKMTSLPANRLRLYDRGRIAPATAADLVIFDPDRIQDLATFGAPLAYSVGVDYLLVNGEVVIDSARVTGRTAGRVLRAQRP